MRYISRNRRFFAPKYRTKKTVKSRIKLVVIAGILLFFASSIISEMALSGVSDDMIDHTLNEYIERSISEIVADYNSNDDFLDICRDETGNIVSAQANTQKINELKANITKSLHKTLNGKVSTSVPIGSSSDISILNGRGFSAPLKLNVKGSAQVSFTTEFVSVGINQSCYRVTMSVNYAVRSESKKFNADIANSTDFIISETIIVGNVPSYAVRTY